MTDESTPGTLALAAISAATDATLSLVEFVREGEGDLREFVIGEVVENMADAAKLTIEASGRSDEEAMQLLAALAKYLDGWS